MMTEKQRRAMGFISDEEDEELVREMVKIMCDQGLTFDRASRVLEDAQKMLPFVAKLKLF